jgi:hypothetical protein
VPHSATFYDTRSSSVHRSVNIFGADTGFVDGGLR